MNFYIPFTKDPDMAESLWEHQRECLADCDLPTTDRRVRALVCEINGVDHYAAVGGDMPSVENDPILLILEATGDEAGIYYVFTRATFLNEEFPISLSLNEHWRVVDFDGGACGWA